MTDNMPSDNDPRCLTDDAAQVQKDTGSVCQVCHNQPHKYRCPKCLIHTCCLKCVQEHKKQSGCNGQRDRTAFVSVDAFTDLHLLSDYRFLEDVERQSTPSNKDPILSRAKFKKPYFLTILINEARRRRINLRVAPYPLSQRVNNKSYFHRNLKQIEWHVCWTLPYAGRVSSDSASLTTITSMVMENVVLKDAIEQLVDHSKTAFPSVTQQLQDLVKGDKPVHVYQKLVKNKRCPLSFIPLDVEKSLGDNLKGSVVREQPLLFLSTEESLCAQDSPQSPPPQSQNTV